MLQQPLNQGVDAVEVEQRLLLVGRAVLLYSIIPPVRVLLVLRDRNVWELKSMAFGKDESVIIVRVRR